MQPNSIKQTGQDIDHSIHKHTGTVPFHNPLTFSFFKTSLNVFHNPLVLMCSNYTNNKVLLQTFGFYSQDLLLV